MNTTTRRWLLARASLLGFGGASLGALALAQSAPGDVSNPVRIRRNIKTLGRHDDDVTAYRMAVTKMRASGAWAQQVAIHADMSMVHHSSWRFLPWHRLQVLHMEMLVARLSGKADFAMPYWDWDDDRIPALFVADDVFRLDGRECTPTSSIAAFLKANDTELVDRSSNDFGAFFGRPRLATDPADFETGRQHYSGSAEWSGHNLMHSFVGGDMGRLDKSPNDPLFWLHHANVDRLWTHWSARHSIGDYAPDWSQESLSGYVNPDGSRSPAALAGTVISPAALGYGYAQPAPVSATRGLATGTGAAPVRIVNYVFEMRRIDPGKGVIDIPPDAGAAFAADAVGYLKIDPDPQHGSVMRLRATDQSDGSVIFDDKVFQVAMGMKMGLQGYRIDLSRVWRGTTGAGLRLEAETGPLVGRQAGPQPPALVSFVVDAKAMFLA